MFGTVLVLCANCRNAWIEPQSAPLVEASCAGVQVRLPNCEKLGP